MGGESLPFSTTDNLSHFFYKNSDRRVKRGDTVTSFDDAQFIIEGGEAPHKSGANGRVYVKDKNNQQHCYYAKVVNTEWRLSNENTQD